MIAVTLAKGMAWAMSCAIVSELAGVEQCCGDRSVLIVDTSRCLTENRV